MSAPRSNRARDDRGAVYIVAVFIVLTMILTAGLVMDLGRQKTARRDAQALSDVIALDMAREADGRTLTIIKNEGAPTSLIAALNRNGFSVDLGDLTRDTNGLYQVTAGDVQVTLEWGWFSDIPSDPGCMGATQVGSGTGLFCPLTDGNSVPNAARATSTDHVNFMLLPAGGGPSGGGVNRSAVARQGGQDLVSFRMGSYLLDGVDEGELDDLFGNLLGAGFDLQAVHYEGLAGWDLTLADILDAHFDGGTPDGVLSQEITFDELAAATFEAMRRNNDDPEVAAQIDIMEGMFRREETVVRDEPITIGDLVAADPSNPDSALDAEVSVLDFLQTGAHLSQCSVGASGELECNGVSLDDWASTIGGVVSVDSRDTTITESPRVYVGNGTEPGPHLTTSQVETTLDLGMTTTPGEDRVDCGFLGLNCTLGNTLGGLLGRLDRIAVVDVEGSVQLRSVLAQATVDELCLNSPVTRDVLLSPVTTSLYQAEARIDLHLENRIYGLLGGLVSSDPFTVSLIVDTEDGLNSEPVSFTDPDDMGPKSVGSSSGLSLDPATIRFEVNGQVTPIEELNELFGLLLNDLVGPTFNSLNAAMTNEDGIVVGVNDLMGELSERLGINFTGADLEGRYVRCGDFGVALVG